MKTPRLFLAALMLFGGLFFAACSEDAEDFSDEELRERLIELIQSDEVDEATATCTIDYLFDNLSREDINQLANAETAEEASEEQVDVLVDGVTQCVLGSTE